MYLLIILYAFFLFLEGLPIPLECDTPWALNFHVYLLAHLNIVS